jgi:hypothetical protein
MPNFYEDASDLVADRAIHKEVFYEALDKHMDVRHRMEDY